MREIKFRLVIVEKHPPYWVKTIEFKYLTLKELMYERVSLPYELGPHYKLFGGRYIKSKDEFTDLKDKNGKEIYEGDIVAGGIVYRASDGAWRVWNKTYGTTVTLWSFAEDTEVIGNIYENPEKMEVTNA